jgi:Uma2 family endonuclease
MNGSTAPAKNLIIPQPKSYTLGEYLVREERSKEKHEFYNGKIIKMPNAKYNHNLIAMNIAFAMSHAFLKNEKNYIVLGEGQKIFIETENIAVYPDALVIFEKPVFYENRQDLLLNPLLVVEVLSRSTSYYDRTAKFELYQMIPSFKEYVLVNPKKIAIETRHQEALNLWRTTPYTVDNQSIMLKSLGIELSMNEIYKNVIF